MVFGAIGLTGRWVLLIMAIVGHFGLYLSIYNRLNALGMPRRRIKQLEWGFLVICLVTPLVLAWAFGDYFREAFFRAGNPPSIPSSLWVYGLICMATWIYPGIAWLWTRPIFGYQWLPVERQVRHVSVDQVVDQPLALSAKCRFQARWPGNQIFQLAIEEKQLPVRGLPADLDGCRIAHLSDIHLTGHIANRYFQFAVEQANDWSPDLAVITGDIVDYDRCIESVDDCFAAVQARFGRFFILGNHDTRVLDPDQVRQRMEGIGWIDLGGRVLGHRIRSTDVRMIGNEAPWFAAPHLDGEAVDSPFTIAACHSPDRIDWARSSGVNLMLAGHTHGGQGRLPLAGPILSPSRYGSRFASGEFYLAPTTMHVSRGLSGVHLLRLRCPPELALLVLRQA